MAPLSRISTSTSPVSEIPARQNEPDMLRLLQAKTAAYDAAQRLYRLQFLLLAVVPLLLAIAQRISPEIGWLTGGAGVFALLVDLLLVEPAQKRRKKLGATFQERFDCELFGLPWRDHHGNVPPRELVQEWADRHSSDEELKIWYRPVVGSVPAIAATIICQRINGYWNSRMRERYAQRIQAVGWIILVATVVLALSMNIELRTVLVAGGLAAPVLRWVLKEMIQQREASEASRKVVQRSDRLWQRLLSSAKRSSVAGIEHEIRELQNDIFTQRCRDPQVFRWVYERWRARDEEIVQAGAEELVAEYRRACPRV